jgi:Multicopper oxidase
LRPQALVTNDDGEAVPPARTVGDPRPPEAWESGFKDTVIAYPGEVTRLRAKFDNPGQFVWHCHIVEHEDNEMMRPYRIGPVQPGEPAQANQVEQAASPEPVSRIERVLRLPP